MNDRRTRLALGTALTVSLAMLPSMALAQDVPGEPSPPDAFTARIVCTEEAPTFIGEQREELFAPGITLSTLGTPTYPIRVDEASDPRFEGEGTMAVNGHLYWEGPSVAEAASPSLADVLSITLRIEGGDGAWEGTTWFLSLAPEHEPSFEGDVATFTGFGTYDGAAALTEMRQGASICEWGLQGVIVEGGLPPAPELSGD